MILKKELVLVNLDIGIMHERFPHQLNQTSNSKKRTEVLVSVQGNEDIQW